MYSAIGTIKKLFWKPPTIVTIGAKNALQNVRAISLRLWCRLLIRSIRAKEAGFFVRLFFVSTESPTINAKRVANRVLNGGHDVPIPKIISRYDKSIANCIALAKYVDRLYVYDNSIENTEARLLFRMSNGKVVKSYTDDVPDWAKTILPK